jgi:hypothetical protein
MTHWDIQISLSFSNSSLLSIKSQEINLLGLNQHFLQNRAELKGKYESPQRHIKNKKYISCWVGMSEKEKERGKEERREGEKIL